jgi:hypothetical protein
MIPRRLVSCLCSLMSVQLPDANLRGSRLISFPRKAIAMNPSPTLIGFPNLPPGAPLSARDVPSPDGLRIEPSTWRAFATSEADALVIGEDPAIRRVLTYVWPTLPKPRFWCDSRQSKPTLLRYCEGTFILQNAHDLEMDDQQRLLEWCGGNQARSRVIATASRQLVTLVEDGGFSRRLYDRLKSAQLLLM